MAPAPTRESLESLKRADLQKLCKDYGVKANLKTETLIDLVLDATQQARHQPSLQPQRPSSTRMVSTRSSGRSRLRSGGSLIIHDTDEEDGENTVEEKSSTHEVSKSDPRTKRTTRKAKETQFRLGVGRPKVAGGAGPRAVTKSAGVLKGKRSSKSTKVVENAIAEDIEPEPTDDNNETPPYLGASDIQHEVTPTIEILPDASDTRHTHEGPMSSSDLSLDKINDYIKEIVRPLQEQIQSFKIEFERLNNQVAELAEAKVKLMNEVETLRGQTRRVEDQTSKMMETVERRPSNGVDLGSQVGRNELSHEPSSSSPNDENKLGGSDLQSGIQQAMYLRQGPTILGKRHRDSSTSDLTGIIEAGTQEDFSEEQLVNKVVRPQKKRPKLSADEEISHMEVAGPSRQDSMEKSSGPAFTVFCGPEEREDYEDPPPPTTHLSDLFGHPPPVTPGNDIRSSAVQALENHNHFGLSFSAFQAVTSTPVYATNGLATYLERPESPTSHVVERTGRQDRASPFFVHRRESEEPEPQEHPSSPSTVNALEHDQRTDPLSDLLKTPPLQAVREGMHSGTQPTGIDVGLGMGLPDIRMEDTPAPPAKRTRYGTELEADTRFGDFGLDGMATGIQWHVSQRRY